MNKQLLIGLCVGGILVTAGGAIALRESGPKVAEIVSVTPVTAGMEQQYAEVLRVVERVEPGAPRFAEVTDARAIMVAGKEEEVCADVVVNRQAPARDEHQIAGTAAGAVIGGVLGNQVGGGNGKKIATAAGAIVGGIVGKKVQEQHQAKQTYQTTERQCRFEQGAERVSGYDVTYKIDGASGLARLSFKPGKHLPLVNGQVVTNKGEVDRLLKAKAPQSYDVLYQLGGTEGSVQMAQAPKVGELLFVENGAVVTDPARRAAIESRQQEIVAYRVSYRIGDDLGEVRMQDRPKGTSLQIKNGQVIMAQNVTP